MNEVAQIISTLGFPIAAFLLMFWFCKDMLSKMQESINTTMREMKQSVDSNTTVITKLIAYMEARDRSDIDGG